MGLAASLCPALPMYDATIQSIKKLERAPDVCPFAGTPIPLADVAQLVEQLIRNQQVIGSSPIVGSIRFPFQKTKLSP
jgi:hypothetical protein